MYCSVPRMVPTRVFRVAQNPVGPDGLRTLAGQVDLGQTVQFAVDQRCQARQRFGVTFASG